MIVTGRYFSKSGLVRLICALSLLLVAFAHKPLSASAAAVALQFAYAGVDVAEFILPDGTLPDLCLEGEGSGEHSGAGHCEACRIVSAAGLPVPMDLYLVNQVPVPVLLASRQKDVAPRPALQPGASPRGPPVSTV